MAIVRIPVTLDYAPDGGPGMNVWHARTVSDSGNDFTEQLTEAVEALETFYDSIRSIYQTTTQIRIGEAMIRDPLGSPEYVPDIARSVNGQSVSGAFSPLLAICVSWRTASATRSGRGRTFLGPLASNIGQDDGTPVTATIGVIQSAAAALVSASQTPFGWSLGVLSPTTGLFRDFTGSQVRDRFAYLSSRRD